MATPISGTRGIMLVNSICVGRYGENWREVRPLSARTFESDGAPIMPPTEWKCLVSLTRMPDYRPPPMLYVVR